ncbi:synaptobrevin-1-like isoform X2 [Ostrea edulis]|uniref:synaptobrevin-1-like isoform X2 n=1 Tax=Ostrea edulis TaxID=37623 RepID=UPI0024AFA798|nr:synaptobrevin-1-like isoform X2 [Ostrea edulis]
MCIGQIEEQGTVATSLTTGNDTQKRNLHLWNLRSASNKRYSNPTTTTKSMAREDAGVQLNIQNPELEDQQNAADLQRIQTQINELVGILGDNMQKLLERSDNLEDMEKLAEKLQDRASEFRVVTKRMRMKHLARNNKWLLVLITIIVVTVIGLVVTVICVERNP